MNHRETSIELSLPVATPAAWLENVLVNFDTFLVDHAANERKASSMAMSLVAHYPDRTRLVTEMIELALEELNHFRQVVRLMQERNLVMTADQKDPYVNTLRSAIRKGPEDYFIDRLLSAAVIEARGEERFQLIARALPAGPLHRFYETLARSERGHHEKFVMLAHEYFETAQVQHRLAEWVQIESEVMLQLPVNGRLH